MHNEEAPLFRIGGATLTNGAFYPDADGAKPDRMLPGLDNGGANTVNVRQLATAAAFGGAGTLQRQYSPNGTDWINDGAAVTAITPVDVTLYRRYSYRWAVGGNDITGAVFYIG